MAQNSENLQKAALFVAALDAETADALLDRLQPAQAGLLRRVLVELDDTENDLQRAAVAEFVGCAPRALDASAKTAEPQESAPVLYGAAAYDQAGRRTPSVATPFRFLHEAPGEDLSELLEGEHPQTVAVVLSHLPPQRAAEAVASLSEGLQADVLRRLARLDETDSATLVAVETELERRFRSRFPADRGRASGVGAVQSILSEASPAVRRSLLAGISRQDPKLATRLTRPSLTFADLPQLTDATLRILCDEADPEILAVAPRRIGIGLHRALCRGAPARASRAVAAGHRYARADAAERRRNRATRAGGIGPSFGSLGPSGMDCRLIS
jgi:flagellar motor switch protein FliG